MTEADLLSRRREITDQLFKYKRRLQNDADCGDSLVRDYPILNREFSVIEQRISVCITKNGDGWLGLIWMDNGQSLEKSNCAKSGPWNDDFGAGTSALPIIQHHHRMTLRKIGDGDTPFKAVLQSHAKSMALPQCSSNLALDYASILSAVDLATRSRIDPFHALIPVFAHAAFSEVAFLNLMKKMIESMMEPLPLDDYDSSRFESLKYYEGILQRHAGQLMDSVRLVRMMNVKYGRNRSRYQLSPSDRVSRPPGRLSSGNIEQATFVEKESYSFSTSFSPPPSSFSATGIVVDYEDLLTRCQDLLSRITAPMNTEMNRAMILESRRAIEQSERMKKLTILATYFLPLTLTASLFGMNIGILGQSNLPWWWYIIVALPYVGVTHFINSWNVQASGRKLRIWMRNRRVVLSE